MARPTRLVSKLRSLGAEIEGWAAANGNGPRRSQRLYREIWEVLTHGGEFEAVRDCSRRAAGLASWIERHLRRDRSNGIGKALLEYTDFAASEAVVCRRWRVRSSEWSYLFELAGYLGEKVRRGVALRKWQNEWLSEVEEQHEKRYLALLENVKNGTVFKKAVEVKWHCRNCGYVHVGKEAPKACPACAHPQSYYEVLAENY